MTWSTRAPLTVLLFASAIVGLGLSDASAQDVVEVDGSADFRSPPFLGPGRYQDTIVTGEAVWYAVLYTDERPYRFEVTIADADPGAEDDFELTTRFITPTLDAVDTGTTLLEGAAFMSGGGTETSVWFLEIALSTSGRLGIQQQVLIDVEGVQSVGTQPCDASPGCTLDDDLSALDDELAKIQSNIDALSSQDGSEVVQAEIEQMATDIVVAESSIEAAEDRQRIATDAVDEAAELIAALCEPLGDCDTPPVRSASTPVWAVIVGLSALVAGAGALGHRLRQP